MKKTIWILLLVIPILSFAQKIKGDNKNIETFFS
ncbi:MAG: hypothetical protein JWQ09_2604 [Segetibacter sp.]|nr:hypothetical protein [Segetibacter sp.]